jgi:hypothetical protein
MDGTGVPAVPSETQGRAGKIEGQRAHTRECKLGCVFTQTRVDDEGRPIRDPDSTICTGAIETAEEFGLRIYRSGMQPKGQLFLDKTDCAPAPVVKPGKEAGNGQLFRFVIADGAVRISGTSLIGTFPEPFKSSISITPVSTYGQSRCYCFQSDSVRQKRWMLSSQHLLDNGCIERLVKRLRKIESENAEVAQKFLLEAEYFERNAQRMRYREFRQFGLFIGPGSNRGRLQKYLSPQE